MEDRSMALRHGYLLRLDHFDIFKRARTSNSYAMTRFLMRASDDLIRLFTPTMPIPVPKYCFGTLERNNC